MKLLKKLRGKNVQITHGLADTLAEIDALPQEVRGPFCDDLSGFLGGLVSHYVLDDGKLVVAHAGMKEEMQGRGSGKVRDFALYGETTGETDEFGLPVRFDWASEYRGQAMVVYGHTPVPEPDWLNRTVNIDTGCVFGGRLTALRYPEKEFVSVSAARTYCEPARPFLAPDEQAPALSAQQVHDEVLDAEDVLGKRIIPTKLRGNVTIREENATAALEVMSRFAADPKWLIYLPPTMSPCETSRVEGLLEHPSEAFTYYRNEGAPQVICEEKHMGSRAVVVACRDESAARDRFGVTTGECGVVVTRTGRRFFNDETLEREFLDRVRVALTTADLWAKLETAWVCLDCELMPWSAKAQELLRTQYAAVGAAGSASLPRAVLALAEAGTRLEGDERTKLAEVEARFRLREQDIDRFVTAYRHYCWTVESLSDLKLAPFHLLATEGHVHTDRDHLWHMVTLAEVCRADTELLMATRHKVVDVTDQASQDEGIAWWHEHTSRGGEGMVVKPLSFIHKGRRGLSQPAVKCRGREYLRIIYGPDYTCEENLGRLRSRGLGRKRHTRPRGVRPGRGRAGAVRAERTTASSPRVRLRRAGPGERARRSEAVIPLTGSSTERSTPVKLLDDDELERSAVVANCRMNRERNLLGPNGYERELGFDPLIFLKARTAIGRPVAWLDLCCGTGKALIQAVEIIQGERLGVHIVGVDLAGMFQWPDPALTCLRLVQDSLSTWRSDRTFDLITCVHGLHYLGDKLGLIARAVSWLVEDGLFVANLDLHNLKISHGYAPARRVASELRRAGLEHDRRRRLVTCLGRREVNLPYRYLGADDQAGPNYTRQPAVDSYYEIIGEAGP